MAQWQGSGTRARIGMSRRRALTLLAAAPGLAISLPWRGARGATEPFLHRWEGRALGARASLTVHHPDAAEARRLISLALEEIERLEGIFSLYRADSAIVRLNAAGRLDDPPLDLVDLLTRAYLWSERTKGAFDVTVQPLWKLYQRHFSQAEADPEGPSREAVAAACRRVDYRALDIAARRVRFSRPGMAITLDGIAQGYITDRIAELLRSEGLARVLVNLGEIRALGAAPGGGAWRVGLEDPRSAGHLLDTLDLVDQAVATSAVTGAGFEASGRFHQLLDPRSGEPTRGRLSASVVADRAGDADALSTALLVADWLPPSAAALTRLGIARIMAVDPDGQVRRLL